MKQLLTLLLASLAIFSCNNTLENNSIKDIKLETDDEKIHYSIGYQYGSNLKQDSIDLIIENYMEGLKDALYKRGNKLDDITYSEMLQRFNEFVMYSRQINPTAITPEQFMKENEARLATIGFEVLDMNSKKPEVKVSDSGLQYTIIRQGNTDKEFIEGNIALLEFKAWFPDSTLITDAIKGGVVTLVAFPTTFTEGWTEAINIIGEGGEIDILTPPDLAFGDLGFPNEIKPENSVPPNVAIFSNIKVLEITPAKDEPRLMELVMEANK